LSSDQNDSNVVCVNLSAYVLVRFVINVAMWERLVNFLIAAPSSVEPRSISPITLAHKPRQRFSARIFDYFADDIALREIAR